MQINARGGQPVGLPSSWGQIVFTQCRRLGQLSHCSQVPLLLGVPPMPAPARPTQSLSRGSEVWRVLTTNVGNEMLTAIITIESGSFPRSLPFLATPPETALAVDRGGLVVGHKTTVDER